MWGQPLADRRFGSQARKKRSVSAQAGTDSENGKQGLLLLLHDPVPQLGFLLRHTLGDILHRCREFFDAGGFLDALRMAVENCLAGAKAEDAVAEIAVIENIKGHNVRDGG